MNTMLKTHTPVTQEKNLGISQTRRQNPLAHGAMVGLLAVFSYGNVAPVNAESSFYCIDDQGLNDSQFCHGSHLPLVALGPLYENCDIEALDISHVTDDLYAAAGDNTPRKSHLYYVYKDSGDVVDLGNIGGPGFLEEVDALSFHPVTDKLWGWAQGEGLFVISTLPTFPEPAIQPIVNINNPLCLKLSEEDVTIPAELVASFANEVEDITWNWIGDVLYAVENLHTNDPDSHGDDEDRWPGPPFNIDYDDGIKLWAYDATYGPRELCPNLAPDIADALGHEAEIEGLEALPNDFLSISTNEDLLIATFHGPSKMYYAAIIARPTLSTPQCNIWIDSLDSVQVPFNDIEGIAYFLELEEEPAPAEPVPACPFVVGGWTLNADLGCDETYSTLPMAFHEDSTWQVDDSGRSGGMGTWEQNDCDVKMFDNYKGLTVIWTGTLEEDGNKLLGTYRFESTTGCWNANRGTPPSSTSYSDPDKSGNELYE